MVDELLRSSLTGGTGASGGGVGAGPDGRMDSRVAMLIAKDTHGLPMLVRALCLEQTANASEEAEYIATARAQPRIAQLALSTLVSLLDSGSPYVMGQIAVRLQRMPGAIDALLEHIRMGQADGCAHTRGFTSILGIELLASLARPPSDPSLLASLAAAGAAPLLIEALEGNAQAPANESAFTCGLVGYRAAEGLAGLGRHDGFASQGRLMIRSNGGDPEQASADGLVSIYCTLVSALLACSPAGIGRSPSPRHRLLRPRLRPRLRPSSSRSGRAAAKETTRKTARRSTRGSRCSAGSCTPSSARWMGRAAPRLLVGWAAVPEGGTATRPPAWA